MAEKNPRIYRLEDNYQALHPLLALAMLAMSLVFLGGFFLMFTQPFSWGAAAGVIFSAFCGYVFASYPFERSIIGKKVTVGLSVSGALVWHKADQLIDADYGCLSLYATVRLAGIGNSRRRFPIYQYNPEKRAYTRLQWSLRKRGRQFDVFELVDENGSALYRGSYIASLLTIARETINLKEALSNGDEARKLTERVGQLEQREAHLGISLVAISERLRLVRPAYQSPHGKLTSELCKEALGQIPVGLVESWKATAHAQWPEIFKPAKKGDQVPTLTPPTPSAEVTA